MHNCCCGMSVDKDTLSIALLSLQFGVNQSNKIKLVKSPVVPVVLSLFFPPHCTDSLVKYECVCAEALWSAILSKMSVVE